MPDLTEFEKRQNVRAHMAGASLTKTAERLDFSSYQSINSRSIDTPPATGVFPAKLPSILIETDVPLI